jgi:hypothetical protein
LIEKCLECLLGATGDGIDFKRSGVYWGLQVTELIAMVWRGYWGLQMTELIANSLEGLLRPTGDGFHIKVSGGVTGRYRGRN